MSCSGQGDQMGEISKEDEGEISSTTPDNTGIQPNLSELAKTDSEPVPNEAGCSEESSAVNEEAQPNLESSSAIVEPVQDIDDKTASTSVVEKGDDDQSITANTPENIDDVTTPPQDKGKIDSVEKDNFIIEVGPNPIISKDIADIIQADAEKDSSSVEDLVLRWDEDEYDENVEATPTDDVLKLLDRELGIIDDTAEKTQDEKHEQKTEYLEISESVAETNIQPNEVINPNKTLKSNEDLDKSVINIENSDVESNEDTDLTKTHKSSMVLADDMKNIENSDENIKKQDNTIDVDKDDSFDETNKIIDEIDDLTNQVEGIDTSVDANAQNVENIDQVDSLTEKNLDEDIFMKDNETEKPTMDAIAKITSKSSPKDDVEEMDVDIPQEKTENILKNSKEPSVQDIIVPIENTKSDEHSLHKLETAEDDENLNKGIGKDDHKDTEMEVSEDTAVKADSSQSIPSSESDLILKEVSGIEILKPKNKDIKINESVVKEITQRTDKDKTDDIKSIQDIDDVSQCLEDESVLDTNITPNVHHRIKKPNVMLDIPTQELSDIEAELDNDDLDSEMLNKEIADDEITLKSKKVDTSLVPSFKINVRKDLIADIKEKDFEIVEKTDTISSTPKTKEVNSPSIEIDGTTSKLNITTVSPSKSDEQASPKSMQVTSASKSLQFDNVEPSKLVGANESKIEHDVKPSTSKSIEEIDLEKPCTSKSVQKIDNEKPSSSKSVQEIGNEKPSSSKSVQEIDTEKPSSSTSVQEIEIEKPSSSKSVQEIDNEKPSSTKSVQEIDNEKPSSTKSVQEIDNEKPTSSKSVQEIDNEKPTSSKSALEIDNEKPSSSKSALEIDNEKLSSSKSALEIDNEKPSSSKSALAIDNEKPSTSKLVQENDNEQSCTTKSVQEIDNAEASPSKSDVVSEKLTSEAAEEVQEIADSLGLLAESSRVMDEDNDDDDDDEVEDPEALENDDDEDFDPYEESSSQMMEDMMEDSSTPPPEMDPKGLEKPFPRPLESDEGTMDMVDDIEYVENELPVMDMPDDTVSETPSTEDKAEKEPETVDANEVKSVGGKFKPENVLKILGKVMGQRKLTEKTRKDPVTLKTANVLTYVEVEGSSDSDDVLEVSKSDTSNSDMISVNIPEGVEVMSTSGARGTSDIVSKKGEVVISGVPKPPPQRMSKINTSEVTIKTAGKSSPALQITEATSTIESKSTKDEIFNLDSDEEDKESKKNCKEDKPKSDVSEPKKEESQKSRQRKCINPQCTNESSLYYRADHTTAKYYSLTKRGVVCERCRQRAKERSEAVLNGIKELCPLLELELEAPSLQLVEISDSDEDEDTGDDMDYIGEKGAKFLEEHLADMINETWVKYKMESRLKDTEAYLISELEKMEAGCKEIDAMLNKCQRKTDEIRTNYYKDFEPRRKSLGAFIIHDTPFSSYTHIEDDNTVQGTSEPETIAGRYPKRRSTSVLETPAKKPAIPMGCMPLDKRRMDQSNDDQTKVDDDKEDISVVKLSAESAPSDLPPCGDIVRPPLQVGMVLYAMRNAFGTWLKGRIMDVQPKNASQQFTQCRVKFEHKVKNPCKVLLARCLAYPEPSEVRMTIGTRVIALFKDPQNTSRRDSFYSGVVAEVPNPVNNYRYLVFFDDGYAQYVHHHDTRIVCESSTLVWEEVHPFIRDFICNYLLSYPERPMVRLHAGEKLKTEWNGKWWDSQVMQVDASIALIHFDEDDRTEWIYRGSTRLAPLYLELQAAEKAGEGKTRSRLPRSKAQMRSNMPCVEYTRSDQASSKVSVETHAQQQHSEEMRRQRSVAKKSTTQLTQAPNVVSGTHFEGVISRVVYYTPKNAVKPYKMSAHTCTIKCKRTDLLSLKDLRTYNPLAKPLLSGWERQTVRYKGHREVMYRAPCGRRLRNMPELHKYLRILQSDLSVDLFDFTPGTHCLAEFVLNKCIVGKKDLSHGKENVPVPCVNYYDESLPEFCSYNTERTPTAGVPLNIDPEFLCGCDCTDDCVDKSKCACWKMTLEGAKTIGLDDPNVGYVYRRLPEPLPSGIYECNSRCKCKQTCLNRVAQHPLNLKLQVFKTINRGWGIRALNDVPKGSFLCVYAGNLLTDATANLDGLNEGDEYLAELDYIEVVEGMKEGYEDDIPDADKKLDKKSRSSESESEPMSESEEEKDPTEKDGDFRPDRYLPHSNMEFKKSLRKREKAKKKEEKKNEEAKKKKDECITISDDEEVREPSRFTAQAGMVDKDLISKHSSRVSVRTLYGKDEACYIVDAKVQGNIGRYLNHSCHPNVFVQNVFVDTHDPRFPWVAFFALSHVRAGTELTWNYNYDIGSVPEKVLYCYCGAPNCRGRLL